MSLEGLQVYFPIRGGLFNRVLGRALSAVRAVDGIDLNVRGAEIVALVGESGSDKATLGRIITELSHATGGRLLFEGRDRLAVQGASALRPYRHRVQMIFQDAYQALNPRRTVFGIVAEPLRSPRLVKNDPQVTERLSEALAPAGLNRPGDFLTRFPHELSGGQRQRVVIAGALAVKPELIAAGGPVSMLDVSIRAQILQVLVDFRDKHNVSLLFTSHDLPLAWLTADGIAVSYPGRLVEIGSADEITVNPRHPYTVALRNATPQLGGNAGGADLPALQDEVPSAGAEVRSVPSTLSTRFDRCRNKRSRRDLSRGMRVAFAPPHHEAPRRSCDPPEDNLMNDAKLLPPLPRAEPRIRVLHNHVTIDHYGWLRDKENPGVRAYLDAENTYAEQATAHLIDLKATLVGEINARQPREERTQAFQVGPFEYFQKTEPGLLHQRWWRRPKAGDLPELVFDPNVLEGTEAFYRLGVFEPSDDGRYVAFSFDVIGNENYELRVRDLETGQDAWQGSMQVVMVAWAADSHTLFFTRERPDARRQIHELIRLSVVTQNIEVMFEEADERLNLAIRRADSGAWLFLDITGVHRGAVEVWCLPADRPAAAWRRLVARGVGNLVVVEHWQDKLLFLVDDAGPYWRLVRAPIDDPSPSHWEEVIPHRDGVLLEEVHVLESRLILLERNGLLPRLVSYDLGGRIGSTIVPDESSCTLRVGVSAGGHYSAPRHRFRSSKLIYSVKSFVTPDTVVEHDLVSDQSTIHHQTRIPGYDAAQYVATVVMAEAEDGVQVPISLVARRDRTGPGPILLNVYGCYGTTMWPSFFAWPSFMTARLSLLDRGVAFGIVHVRGGGEFGRPWHQGATRDRKHITYTDLIAAAEGLVQQGIATRQGIVIEGQSAGGGTVLAAAVLRPDLFRAVLAQVPLADLIDTELDFTRPYALQETAEYSDPHFAHEYRYLRRYDPFYNLSADRPLPPTYVDAALDDSQVLYHQPARYVAQRRSGVIDRDPRLVFCTRTVGGHSGPSHGPGVAAQAASRMSWILDQFQLPSD